MTVVSPDVLVGLLIKRAGLTLAEATRAAGDPTIVGFLLDMLEADEWFVAGRMAWVADNVVAAVAAENAHGQIWNDSTADRPTLVVVQGLIMTAAAAETVLVTLDNGKLTAQGGLVKYRDAQWNPALAAALVPDIQARNQSLAGIITPALRLSVGTASPIIPLVLDWILAPQTGLHVVGVTVNTTLNVDAWGYRIDLRAR